MIEAGIPGYLKEELLTEDVISHLVTRANEILDQEARKPAPDILPLEKQVSDLKRRVDRLVKRLSECDDTSVADSIEAEIKRLTHQNQELQAGLIDARQAATLRIERLDLQSARELLSDLRHVLAADTTAAALAIRDLTGPIRICQEPIAGKAKQFCWIASFSPRWVTLLARVCPTAGGRFAATADEMSPGEPVKIVLQSLPKYERFARQVQSLKHQGVRMTAIGRQLGLTECQTYQALHFAESGERPRQQARRTKAAGKSGKPEAKFKAIAPEVQRLRETENLTFSRIVRRLGVALETATKAYDFIRPDLAPERLDEGRLTTRRRSNSLPESIVADIQRLRSEGQSIQKIARNLRRSDSTVKRVLQQFKCPAPASPARRVTGRD